MFKRTIENELAIYLSEFPAVTLVGARQTGKTTTARKVAESLGNQAVYFDLERPSDRAKLIDAETLLTSLQDKCVIIDEAQTLPELFTVLRPLIDDNRRAGRFLLLGSVAPTLVRGISETLAGRIGQLELGTLNVVEIPENNLQQHWFRGGYPDALQAKSDTAFLRWAQNYYLHFAERDVNFLMGESLSPTAVKKLWQMLAGINGTLWNTETIARSLGLNRITVNKYADFMEGAFLITRLQPWSGNSGKRLVKSAKVYFKDTGVLHYLNKAHSYTDLLGNICAGGSWEGFVLAQITQLKPLDLSCYFYRTHHGAEADIVLVKGQTPIACIEVKLNNAPTVSRGFHEVIADLKTTQNFVITPGSDVYTAKGNITVSGLLHFVKNILPTLGQTPLQSTVFN